MVLANRYDVTRLQQLCEDKLASYIWEALEQISDQPGAILDLQSEMDFTLAELMEFAKEHNAKQLEAYCNHLWSFYPQHFQTELEGEGEGKSKGKGKERLRAHKGKYPDGGHPVCSIM